MKNKNVMRDELPNPAFARQNWRTLNGAWEFAFDHDNKYEKMSIDSVPFDREIQVPFCYRTKLSGINAVRDCQNVWYRRGITVTKEELAGSVLLHFGAVDYCAKVWINGVFAGSHTGGHTHFYFDIAPFLKPGDRKVLVVKAEDSYSMDQPRGKQMWGPENTLCWYDNTVGIWQSVWLEFTGKAYLTHIRITPYLDRNLAHFEVQSNSDEPLTVLATVSKEEKTLGTMSVEAPAGRTDMIFTFEEFAARAVLDLYWSPESPVLIDVELKLMQGDQVLDTVATYFGMRKIHTDGDRVFLNNQLLYQRLVLDQGYWPEGFMTAPSDEAIRLDVEIAKSMGFNGVRKHQKIEDPRFYYGDAGIWMPDTGKLAMQLDWYWTSSEMKSDERLNLGQEWYIYPTPSNSGRLVTAIDVAAIAQTCEHPEEAYELLKFMTFGAEGWEVRCSWHSFMNKDISALPTTTDDAVWNKIKTLNPGEDYAALYDALKNAAPELARCLPGYNAWWGWTFEQDIWGKLASGTVKAEDIEAQMEAKMTTLYNEAMHRILSREN